MMSIATTFITLLTLTSTVLALPVPEVHQNEKRYSGVRMTYYDTSVGLGACGNLNQNSAWTVALNSAQFGNSYPSSECGKTITISMGGKTAQAVIQDSCPSCPYGGLDLSPSLFQHFADLGTGVISGDWDYGSGYVAPAPAPEPTTSHTPTSTYVAPTTSWTPEPSTSTTPTPTSTWVAPTTSSAAPSSSYTPSTSATPSSSVAASSSSSTSASAASSSSASNSASSANASQTESLLSALLGSSTGTVSRAAAAATATSGSGSESTGTDSDGNLQMLSDVIVNLGRLVVMAA